MKKITLPKSAFILIVMSMLTAGIVVTSCKSGKTPSIILSNPVRVDSIADSFVKEGYYPFIYVRLEDKEGRLIYEHSTVNQKLFPGMVVDGNTWMRIWSR